MWHGQYVTALGACRAIFIVLQHPEDGGNMCSRNYMASLRN